MLLAATGLHQLGAAFWIGGLPALLASLRLTPGLRPAGRPALLAPGRRRRRADPARHRRLLGRLYRQCRGGLRHRLWRHVRHQGADAGDAAGARRVATGWLLHRMARVRSRAAAGPPLRRGGDHPRHRRAGRRRLPHLGPPGRRPAGGPGDLGRDHRALHPGLAALRQPEPCRPGHPRAAGPARCRMAAAPGGAGEQAGSLHPRRGPAAAAQRPGHRLEPSTTTTGPGSWCCWSASPRCWTPPAGCAGAALAAGLHRPGRLHLPALRPGGLAARGDRAAGQPARPGGGAAQAGRAAGGGLRRRRMVGAAGPDHGAGRASSSPPPWWPAACCCWRIPTPSPT